MAKDRSEDRHAGHRHMVTFDDADWADFGELVGGDPARGEVLRQFVRAMLGRPGAKVPRRRTYEKTPPPEG
jgi:hypothetical protein